MPFLISFPNKIFQIIDQFISLMLNSFSILSHDKAEKLALLALLPFVWMGFISVSAPIISLTFKAKSYLEIKPTLE